MTDERRLIESLKAGDERAFAWLLDQYSSALLRVAMTHVATRAVAEEVVQETWLGVISGIDRFEGRSSLKTWIFRILTNTASTRGRSASGARCPSPRWRRPTTTRRRSTPTASLRPTTPAIRTTGRSARAPGRRRRTGCLSSETREVILRAIDALPEAQRVVVTLRDLEGWEPEEVCDALTLSDGNQRVLLHRARTKVRAALESYLGAVEETVPVTPAA